MDAWDLVFMQGDGGQRISPILPDRGRPPAVDWITSSDQMLEVMIQFIDHVIPGQRFALAAISYGGYLARGIVHRRTSLIDGAVLIVPVITPDEAKRIKPEHVVLVRDEGFIVELANFDANIARGVKEG